MHVRVVLYLGQVKLDSIRNRGYLMISSLFGPAPEKAIDVYGICSVMDEIDPDGKLSWEESGEKVREWCNTHDACYYARPRESFSTHEAIEQARKEGKSRVVVEDLS